MPKHALMFLTGMVLCARPALATNYTFANTANANWTLASQWVPSGGPPASTNDTGLIANNGWVPNANASLGTLGNQPTIVVSNGTLNVISNTSGDNLILDSGTMNFTASAAITNADIITIRRGALMIAGASATSYIQGPLSNGTPTGLLTIKATSSSSRPLVFLGSNNTFSGGIVITGYVNAAAAGCLGLGTVSIVSTSTTSQSTLTILTTNAVTTNTITAYNSTSPSIFVTNKSAYGAIVLGASTYNHLLVLQQGAIECNAAATFTSTDTIQLNGTGVFYTAFSGSRLVIQGLIKDGSGPGKLYLNPNITGSSPCLIISNAVNTYSGGTEVVGGGFPGNSSSAAGAGSLGSGPITVDNGMLLWFQPSTVTLSNTLVGGGTIAANNGNSGGTISLTNAVITPLNTPYPTVPSSPGGKLSLTGSLALQGGAGSYCGLYINLAKVSGTLTNDLLAVSQNITGLTSANLYVTISTNVAATDLTGKSFTILTCANNLAGPGTNFNAVVWGSSWKGNVVYGNGSVALANLQKRIPGTIVTIR